MRTFEFRDGKSAKFWSVDLRGKRFAVRYGKIGTAGQEQAKDFADAAAAQKEHDKLIAEKLAKGYVEVTAAPAAARAPAAKAPAGKPPKKGKAAAAPKATPPADPGRPPTTGRSDPDGLLAAVRAEPDDDAPRLVLADWLEEHGDGARAEFIRVQCRLARQGVTQDWLTYRLGDLSAEVKALLEREKELLAGHGAEWQTGLLPETALPKQFGRGHAASFYCSFHRGMIRLTLAIANEQLIPENHERLRSDLSALERLAGRPCFRWVAEVVLDASGGGDENTVDSGQDYAALFTHPALRHVTRFYLNSMFGTATVDLSPLAGRRDLERLMQLSVRAGAQEDAYVDASALWESPAVANLRRLDFRGPFDESDYLPLVQSTRLSRLRSLSIRFSHVNASADGDRVLAALAESSHFPELQEVSLGEARYDFLYRPGSVLAVLRSPGLPSLEYVAFDFLQADPGSWEEWAAASPDDLPGDPAGFVRELTAVAEACRRGDPVRRVGCGIDLLLLSPGLGGRDAVSPAPLPTDLSHTGLGDAVLSAIAVSPHLARLVNPNPGGGKPKKSASKKKSAARPIELNLSGNTFGDAGALALADSPHAAGLQRVDVSGNRLSAQALARLRERFLEVVCDERR